MLTPDNLKYTPEHEWVELLGENRIRVGITDYAQDALGDVVFVQLPKVDAKLTGHALLAEVESTKSVAEVYAPASGTVSEVEPGIGQSSGTDQSGSLRRWMVLRPDRGGQRRRRGPARCRGLSITHRVID